MSRQDRAERYCSRVKRVGRRLERTLGHVQAFDQFRAAASALALTMDGPVPTGPSIDESYSEILQPCRASDLFAEAICFAFGLL